MPLFLSYLDMKLVELGNTGEKIPILGIGTWGIGRFFKNKEYYEDWKKSLRRGIELGMSHIDTAELYGLGASERTVGEIIKEYDRDDLFITTKLFPVHTFYHGMKRAAERSLKRLGIKSVDLYLIHFPSFLVPLKRHAKLLDYLIDEGKTRFIGVSNFSVDQFKEIKGYLRHPDLLVTNQLRLNLTDQKYLHEALPYYQKNKTTLTAYSPLGHEGFTDIDGELREKLEKVAKSHDATIQQIGIAWLINHENVITIPKAFHVKHVESNAKAADITLTEEEIKMFYERKSDAKVLEIRREPVPKREKMIEHQA